MQLALGERVVGAARDPWHLGPGQLAPQAVAQGRPTWQVTRWPVDRAEFNRLVEEGIFERVLYQERPARYEYCLTPKGSDLFTALNALRQWGDQYLSAKPMRLLRQKHDKTPVIAALVPEGTPVLAAHEIELVPGPGFPRRGHRK